MLLGKVVHEGVWRIPTREFAGIADDNWLWLVLQKIISGKKFSDIVATAVHVRHCSGDRRLYQQQRDKRKSLRSRSIRFAGNTCIENRLENTQEH